MILDFERIDEYREGKGNLNPWGREILVYKTESNIPVLKINVILFSMFFLLTV